MVSEFEFIENLKSSYSLDKVGDDCAVLPKDANTDLLLTVDMLVEDVDFRLKWAPPESIGHKALAVSLSDVAAMGGEPKWAMLSIGIPHELWHTDFVDRLYTSWFSLADEVGVELIGGDISKTANKVVLDSIVGGEVDKGQAILRSGAQVGDLIFVTGSLGGAAAGLKYLEEGAYYQNEDKQWVQDLGLRLLYPNPQLLLAKWLRVRQITAMIDLSDGLSSDLMHVCRKSGVGARLYSQNIPISGDLERLKITNDEMLSMALHGGEDFELLFTTSKENISHLKWLPVHHIGEITANTDVIELAVGNNTSRLYPKGYSHF